MAPPTRYISATDIRRLFNEGRYEELVQPYGVLREILIREGTPALSSNQILGTKSQIIAYVDADNVKVAVVHRYLRPDGTLGGSGRNDPKKLLHKGILYSVLRDKE